jgi:hypothetical protein
MFLTLHAAAGALAGELSPNYGSAAAFGFLTHFPLDMFPHGDRAFGRRTKESGKAHGYTLMIIADAVAALALMYAAVLTGRFDRPFHAFLGALAGVLPDVVVGLTEYAQVIKKSARTYFRRFYRFHTFVHNRVITAYDFGMKFGLVYQAIVLLLILKFW